MKPEVLSRYHTILKLIDSINKFEEDVFWDIVRVALEVMPEEKIDFVIERVVGEILNDVELIRKFNRPSIEVSRRAKSRQPKAEEEDPEAVKEKVYNEIERLLCYDYSKDHSRRFVNVDVRRIRRDISRASSMLPGREYKKLRNELMNNLKDELLDLIKGNNDLLGERVKKIAKYFDLEEFEERFILLVFHETFFVDTALSEFIRSEPEVTKVFCGTNEIYEEYELIDNDDDHPLIQKGLLSVSRSRSSLLLTKTCLQWILSENDPDLLDMFLQIENCNESFDLHSFPIEESTVEVCKNILSAKVGCNILIHGREGTGKTEFSKSIAKEIGLKCFFLRPFNKKGKDSISERRMALYVASRIMSNIENSVLIVDEADDLLYTSKGFSFFGVSLGSKDDDKAWVNQFMDKSQSKIVWIANDLNLHPELPQL